MHTATLDNGEVSSSRKISR